LAANYRCRDLVRASMNGCPPILIVGLPRSGTTWVGEVLSSARATTYISEPDNEKLSPLAWLCKGSLHRFPYLTHADSAPGYEEFWATALAGRDWTWSLNTALGMILRERAAGLEACVGEKTGYVYLDRSMRTVGARRRKTPFHAENHRLMAHLIRRLLLRSSPGPGGQRIIIKSVHAPLSVDWIGGHFDVTVVFVLRNPHSLYASYKRMRMPDGFRNLHIQETLRRDMPRYLPKESLPLLPEPMDPVFFQIMLMYKIIEQQIEAHPKWVLVSHDRLCITPQESYQHMFGKLGLAWSDNTHQKIDSLNRPGAGFAIRRVSSQQPAKWKAELSVTERMNIERWRDWFGCGISFVSMWTSNDR